MTHDVYCPHVQDPDARCLCTVIAAVRADERALGTMERRRRMVAKALDFERRHPYSEVAQRVIDRYMTDGA